VDASSDGPSRKLGAPGPQNSTSPIQPTRLAATYAVSALDPCVYPNSPPNAVRDFTSNPGDNSTFGTLTLRLRVTNLSGAGTSRLRFRIVDLTTFPALPGTADLRLLTSTSSVVTIDGAPCGGGTSNVTAQGMVLEQPPARPEGGGINSSVSASTITMATPLPVNQSINLNLKFGVEQEGRYHIGFFIETLPGGGTFHYITGGGAIPGKVPFDFTGEGTSDISIFRPGSGQWWVGASATTFGTSTDKLVPGDYTGDGRADHAFFRPSTGEWFVLRSEDFAYFAVPFGLSTDTPVPADYDGDGRTDFAVHRVSGGSSTWWIRRSSDGVITSTAWGSSGDRPVPADFDGDGRADVSIFRPSNGQWWARYATGQVFAAQFGTSTDLAVPGKFTPDERADLAFWRPSTGFWYVLRSEDLQYYAFPFGSTGDLPLMGSFDGSERANAAVYRPSTARWYYKHNFGTTVTEQTYGLPGDVPVPNAYVR
jgi:hypothetical protein